MKEILAATAVIGSFASLWFATYYTMKASEPSPGTRHAVAGVIALIGGVLLAWLVSPSDGSTEMGWGWVLLALVISIFLVRVAAVTPESLSEVLAREQSATEPHVQQPRPAALAPLPLVKQPVQPVPVLDWDLQLDDERAVEDDDDDFSYLHPDAIDHQVVSFLYENSQGELSSRHVTVEQVGTSHFAGMCHRENAERTFRFDRIQGSVTDEASGKLIMPRKLRDFLRGYGEQEVRRQNRARAKNAPEILFTGFKQDRRAVLEEQAEAAGMTVRKRVTENLDFLCGGYNAGPSKLADARANGVTVLNEEQFEHLLVTGEVPG